MTIAAYGNEANFSAVLKVDIIDGSLEGVKRVIIHQLVEDDREDLDFEPFNGRLTMQHSIYLFPKNDDIEVNIE